MTVGTLGSSVALALSNGLDSCGSRAVARNGGGQAAKRCEPAEGGCAKPAAPALSETTAAALRYRRTERTALYIETQEGDLVKLRIKVKDSLAASSASDGSSSEVAVSSRSQTKISFHVEGDLNADELAAIRSVVEQAAELATEFFAGDLPEAFATATALQIDGSQLARVGLKLSLREQATYAILGARPMPAAPAPAPSPAPATPVEAPTPAASSLPAAPSSAPQSSNDSPHAVDTAPTETPPTPAPAEEPAAPPAAPAPNVASSALSLIASFLDGLLATLAGTATEEDNASSLALDVSLRLHLYRATLIELAAVQPATAAEATSGVPLAADTLDALAAAQQGPLATEA